MKSNFEVAQSFWEKKGCQNNSMTSTGDRLFSYNTCILQRTSYGYTIGNLTKYSQTARKHQSIANVRKATYYVLNVPIGGRYLLWFKKKRGVRRVK